MNGYMSELFRLEHQAGFPFRHIHGAGRNYEEMAKAAPKDPALDLRQYIYDMPLAMAAADLVICRSGASTISELSAIAKPSILVPSPNVTADHQTKNAKVLSAAGGAVLLPEGACSGEKLWEMASDLLNNREKREAMSRALREMAVPDAAEQIYTALTGLLNESSR